MDVVATLNAVAILLIGFGLAYFIATMALGRRFLRRHSDDKINSSGIGRARASGVDIAGAQASGFTVYFVIACLNEETVIAESVRRLLVNRDVHVVVIDDGSDDATTASAHQAGDERVIVVQRHAPDAREGKGPALNSGFYHVVEDVRERGLDPNHVLVCVMDADGQLSERALEHVRPLFADPQVGGVQLAVRIRNRKRLLTAMQDLEFWGLSATSQFGRVASRTVSLGGNGQFTRLGALMALGRRPWSRSLTEDLDLCLSLLLEGWELTTTPHAWVEQQGVDTLRRLARQRTRWMQGHMMCGARIPKLWACPKLSHLSVLETTLYLLVPWALVLPWSIIFHIGLYNLISLVTTSGASALLGDGQWTRVLYGSMWYLASFSPNIAAAHLYRQRDPEVGWAKALLLGHVLVLFNYVAYFACWRALFRILARRRGWAKTTRTVESRGLTGATP